jgi:CDP-paratose 2-epimerase
MRILITGGAGFIGSNLAVYFRQAFPSADVVCMDNLYRRGSELNVARLLGKGVLFHWGDVRAPLTFPRGPFDFLIECSAEPSVLAGFEGSPDYLFQTNLTGAYHCLEKVRQWNSRVVFLSTSRVYPIRLLERHPWHEEETRFVWEDTGTPGITSRGVSENVDMNGARSLYGFTKYAAELLIEEYRSSWGLKAIVNRCGVIAGPWQFGKVDQGVVTLWVLAHYFNRPLSYIGFGGSGKQVRDTLHVADLCELIGEQIENFDQWDGWVGNVCGGLDNSVSLLELTARCREVLGKSIAIAQVPENRPNDLRLFVGDNTRLYERNPWRPSRQIRDIVGDISGWISEREKDLRQLVN